MAPKVDCAFRTCNGYKAQLNHGLPNEISFSHASRAGHIIVLFTDEAISVL